LTTLAHHIDIDWLREAYRRTRKDGATGVDRQKADEYASRLEENLRSLLERAKSGSYLAPPVRRVHIPKGDGSQTCHRCTDGQRIVRGHPTPIQIRLL
jgi:retron-type reverse transcriptase